VTALSVIICTYRRTEPVAQLLACLARQTFADFEVLLVDGAGASGYAQSLANVERHAPQLAVRVIASEKGLTRQRNAGLRAARGELICLLDDDVAFEADFLAKIVEAFARPGMERVGGLTGYDVIHYPQAINARWRLRRMLRIVPALEPGAIDRLGASVPVSFCAPFAGSKPVGFFYGFCMIYRRAAIAGLWFDEELPTYGGEDRDFSFRVGRGWELRLDGDLKLRHFRSGESRDSSVERTRQTGFGAGRTFAKQRRYAFDYARLAWSMAGEFLIDTLAFVESPSRDRARMPWARVAGTLAGACSAPPKPPARGLRPVPGSAESSESVNPERVNV
jgi:glycosyltransferase involved in cell wall biosynthesis